jgi:hypothetical protein
MKNKLIFRNKRIMHLIILLLIFSSCTKENDSSDLDINGSYDLTITGDENRTLKGEANFMQVVVSGGSASSGGASLVVNLTSGDEESLVLTFAQEDEKVFSVKNYIFAEEDLDGKTYFSVGFYSSESMITYLISSGSINLTKISNKTIEGDIDIVMSNFTNDDIVNIKGSFKALGITQIF